MSRALVRAGVLVLFLLVGGRPLLGQVPPAEGEQPAVEVPSAPSPGGAFLRSLILPGWGQASFGAHFRGGVYFATQMGSSYMLFRTATKLGDARDLEERRRTAVEDSLWAAAAEDPELAERLQDPAELAAAIDAHPGVERAVVLVRSREQQREDWITWLIFWTLASGVDAFVTAHLSDFPAGISVESRSGPGIRLKLSVPVGRVR